MIVGQPFQAVARLGKARLESPAYIGQTGLFTLRNPAGFSV